MTIIIAIDGPAASGKGTLARALAARLNYAYLDTGTLYRAVAFEVLEAGGDPEDEAQAVQGAETLVNKIHEASSPSIILHNESLREEHVGEGASKVAAMQAVRDRLTQFQRDFAANPNGTAPSTSTSMPAPDNILHNVGPKEGEASSDGNTDGNTDAQENTPFKGAILDGRDIGTVICPDADVKFYVQASMEIRAQRRTKELQSKGIDVTKAHVLQDMQARDQRDMQRQAAPLKPAEDAIVFDTSDLGPDEVVEKALKIIEERLSS